MQNIKNKHIAFLFTVVLLSACQFFKTAENKTPIAQIFDKTLYLQDINPSIYKNKSPEDSTKQIHQFIEKWAYQNLMIDEAKKNIDTLKINRLVTNYKNDLLTETYMDKLIGKYLDTLVPEDTLKIYYHKIADIYKAREPMAQIKYLVFDKENKNRYKYQKWFYSNKEEEKDTLFKLTSNFKKMDLLGQKWLNYSDMVKEIPAFKRFKPAQIIKKSKKFVLTDSLSLYLVFINNVVHEDEPLPFDFVKNDIKQIVLGKRKEILKNKLMNDLKEEAIKHKQFKIYKIKK